LLGAGSALQVLALVGAGVAIGTLATAPAAAQDLTAGVIAGAVTNESGAAVTGASVTLTSLDQGFTRTARTSANGNFRFVGLPPGRYTVTVEAAGQDTFTANDVFVQASQTANLNIGMTTTGNEIIVTASTIQAPFTGTTSGVTVDVAELASRVPVGRDVTNLMLLAPGTSRGESTFGGKAANFVSIGGSSVAENAYYINGLNITNFDNYLGGAEVPFEFYKSVEVKSGGYPAEFGRATGGIVNAVSKAGGNEFQAALHLNWAPNFLRSDGKDLLTCGANGCEPYTNRRYDTDETYSAIVEASGPIIKDRLFVYGLLEMRHRNRITIDRSSSLATQREENDPFWAVKVDAFPIDNHHLEFTIFDTRNSERNSNRAYSEDAAGVPHFGVSGATFNENSGGVNYVAKYTGTFTNWLTVSGAYGRMRDRFDTTPLDPGADQPFIQNASGVDVIGPDGDPVPHGGVFTAQTNSITDSPYAIEREFFRGDADLFFNAFGDHHVRFGFDQENNTLDHVAVSPGASVLCDGYLSDQACAGVLAPSGSRLILRSVGAQRQVEINYYNTGGTFDATNRAFYIQDEWQPFDRLTLSLGVRRDDFKLSKSDGSDLIKLDENYAPRIGATYDVWPDRSGKIRAFYGQYFLPVASNTAFRQASPEVYFRERFEFDGWDGSGLPILGDQITDLPSYQSTCPFALTTLSSGFNCTITGDGSVPDTGAGISHNLKATKESEWIIGYEHRLGEWTVGLTYTHRNMDRSAEDMAIDRAVINYCVANGIPITPITDPTDPNDPGRTGGCEDIWTGFHQYVVTNPGSDMIIDLTDPLPGETNIRTLTFTAADLKAIGFPKATRKYDSVELTAKRPWDGKWAFEANYTWSQSKGNSEGFVQSDFQQDDSGITQDFDQPGFIEGAYGLLPNHRRHRLKAWGAYSLFDGFTLGSNVTIESPRPLSCFGYHPGSAITDGSFENGYGAASHYCGGKLSPRGTAQKSQWVYQVDLSARYNVEIPTGQLVTLRADVFNVFNTRRVQDRYEIGDIDENFNPHPNFGQPRLYQSPRSVRLGMDISF
jgi:outer membrane receptor protein involved in Fe transport